jgi:hypothetical protein
MPDFPYGFVVSGFYAGKVRKKAEKRDVKGMEEIKRREPAKRPAL